MNNNLGKAILKYRKEKCLTQEQFGDMLGVTSKAVSKWETNKGFPDISILEKISQILGVTIDDLIKGNNNKPKSNRKIITSIALIIIVLIVVIINLLILNKNKINNKKTQKEEYPCTKIANYYIKLITNSNDENYKYITISEFQKEGTYTIKLPVSITTTLEQNKRYKFTLKTKENYDNIPTDILFKNSNIINIEPSQETELWSKYTCDKIKE